MEGVTNLTNNNNVSSNLGAMQSRKANTVLSTNADGNSMIGFAKGGGMSVDASRLGHVTRTTEYTSNVGANTTTHEGLHGAGADRAISAAAGPISFGAPGSITPGPPRSDHT